MDPLTSPLTIYPVGDRMTLLYVGMAAQFILYLVPAVIAWVVMDRRSVASFRPEERVDVEQRPDPHRKAA